MNRKDLASSGLPLLTVDEAAALLGLRRTATYDAIRRGQLPSVRPGRRLFVPVPSLLTMLGVYSYNVASDGGSRFGLAAFGRESA